MIRPTAENREIRIGLLADTHLDQAWDDAPFRILRDTLFRDVTMVLHAGDVGDLDWLEKNAFPDIPLVAVAGNCDPPGDPRLPPRRIMELGGWRIGLCHGSGPAAETPERVRRLFADEDVAAVVFGHTHHPYLATIGRVTYFNPGSMFWPRGGAPTVGLARILDRRIIWQHHVFTGHGG